MDDRTPEADTPSTPEGWKEVGGELNDQAIQLAGLCETLCWVCGETIVTGDFRDAHKLGWSYECLAKLARDLAERLHESAP